VVPGGDAAMATSWHHSVHGDDLTLFENAYLVGHAVYLDHALPRGFLHAIEIAIHPHVAVARNPSLEPQHGLKRSGRKQPQFGLLLGKMLSDHSLGGRVGAYVW